MGVLPLPKTSRTAGSVTQVLTAISDSFCLCNWVLGIYMNRRPSLWRGTPGNNTGLRALAYPPTGLKGISSAFPTLPDLQGLHPHLHQRRRFPLPLLLLLLLTQNPFQSKCLLLCQGVFCILRQLLHTSRKPQAVS